MSLEELKLKLAAKQPRVELRHRYYEMKNSMLDLKISTPDVPRLTALTPCLGWCAKSVDAVADRLVFRDFKNDNFNMMEIFRLNNPDVLFPDGISSALISACSFIHIGVDGSGFPKMEVIDGSRATGEMDSRTGMLTEGYAILKTDKNERPIITAHFLPGETRYYYAGEKRPEVWKFQAPYPMLVPLVHRPGAKRPFGHARISRAQMSIVQSALRTVKRSEISAEFYSFPQRYVLGTDPDAEALEKWKAAMSAVLEITKDEDNDKPTVGQFQQASMEPHSKQLRDFAALFAGESGLTLDDLGFTTDNPASADAIRSSHETLRLAARSAQRSFGTGFLNAGYLAVCVRDKKPYERAAVYETKPAWEPIFTPDSAMLSNIGDGAIKLNQAVPGFVTGDTLHDLTGIEGGNA